MTSLISNKLNVLTFFVLFITATLFIGCSDDEASFEFDEEELCFIDTGNGDFRELKLSEAPIYLDGGHEGFLSAFYENNNYPAAARENGIEGVCDLQYEITEEGTIENIVILQDPGGGIGAGASSALQETTAGVSFSPGFLNDDPVRVRKELRITYKLQ